MYLTDDELAAEFGGRRQTAMRVVDRGKVLTLVNDGVATGFRSVFAEARQAHLRSCRGSRAASARAPW